MEGSGPVPSLHRPRVCVLAEGLPRGEPPVSSPVQGRGGGRASLPGRGMRGDKEWSGYRAGNPRPWEIWDGRGELGSRTRAEPGGERPGDGEKGPSAAPERRGTAGARTGCAPRRGWGSARPRRAPGLGGRGHPRPSPKEPGERSGGRGTERRAAAGVVCPGRSQGGGTRLNPSPNCRRLAAGEGGRGGDGWEGPGPAPPHTRGQSGPEDSGGERFSVARGIGLPGQPKINESDTGAGRGRGGRG